MKDSKDMTRAEDLADHEGRQILDTPLNIYQSRKSLGWTNRKAFRIIHLSAIPRCESEYEQSGRRYEGDPED